MTLPSTKQQRERAGPSAFCQGWKATLFGEEQLRLERNGAMCAPVGEVEPYAAVKDDVYCVARVAGARQHAAGVQSHPIRGEVYL